MLNLCFFIFVIYAVSYSAKAILFGKSGKKQKKAYCTARNATVQTNIKPQRRKRSNPNIVKIRQTKSGRMGKSPVRPVLFQFCIDIIIMLVYYKYSNGTVLAVLLIVGYIFTTALYCSTGRLFFYVFYNFKDNYQQNNQ